MKQLIVSGEVGELYYFDSVRINLGLFQTDVNVIWDLAPHDVSIMAYVVGGDPVAVSATGAAHAGSPTANIAYVTGRGAGAPTAGRPGSGAAPPPARTPHTGACARTPASAPAARSR